MPYINYQRPWNRQPPPGTPLDLTNPIAKKLVQVFLFQNQAKDLINNDIYANSGITFHHGRDPYFVTSDAQADDFTGGDTGSAYEGGDGSFSFFTIARASDGQSSGRRLIHYGANFLGSAGGFLVSNGSDENCNIGIGTAEGFKSSVFGAGFWDNGTRGIYSGHLDGTAIRIYKNGRFFASSSLSDPRNTATDNSVTLFQRPDNGANRHWNGDCAVLYMAAEPFTDAEHISLHADHFQVFEPEIIRVWVPEVAAADVLMGQAWM